MKNIKIKLVVLGDMSTGKSSILNKYVNKNFITNNTSTIGVDFFKNSLEYNNNIYELFIWDTSGQEKFSSIVTSYYRNITCAIIVFDLTNKDTFKNLTKWIEEVYFYSNKDIILRIVGSKYDIKNNIINEYEIKDFCKYNDITYVETSAKTNYNIDELFQNIIEEIDLKLIEGKLFPSSKNGIVIKDTFNTSFNLTNKEIKHKCCIIL